MRLLHRALPVALGIALAPLPALAQGTDEFGAYAVDEKKYESPQHVAVEIRFGRYKPRVDNEFDNGATPFEDVFGDDKRYAVGFEVDWQALRVPHVGTFGPALNWSFTKFSGYGFRESDGSRSTAETTFKVMPMFLLGVFRVDVLARETPIPLVGYGKAGLGMGPWWTTGSGQPSKVGGEAGKSISYGYEFAVGAMLLLDVFDPHAAIEMDANTGVNNSYVFFEWYFSDLDDFGGGDMQVGTSTWAIGLALEI